MSDSTEPNAIIEVSKGAAGLAGGGGLIATLLHWLRGREEAKLRDRVSALEAEVVGLRRDLDRLFPTKRRTTTRRVKK